MSSKFNLMLHGSAAEASELVNQGRITEVELRAALCNALNRIERLEQNAARPVPVYRQYKIAAVPLEDFTHDLDEDVAGTYFYTARSEEEALDIFHRTVPIKMLEDFEIDVEVDELGPRCHDCGTQYQPEAIGEVCSSCHRGMVA